MHSYPLSLPVSCATILVSVLAFALPASSSASLVRDDGIHRVAERGQDYAVIERVTSTVNLVGETILETNRLTLLENCLHYQEDDQWRLSEDLIESFPDGAIARRGPNKAIFSHELNAATVFDIAGSDGKRTRGGYGPFS